MDTIDFLRRVLPHAGGSYFAAAADKAGLKQTRLDSMEAVDKYIKQVRKAHDVYVALGAFKQRRLAADCTFKRALYVDLDCGLGKPFVDKHAAVSALRTYCKTHFTLPNLIVDSGGGVHAYWTFTADTPTPRWHLLASALKQSCLDNGFTIDPSVSADAARIMRAPNTANFKHGTPILATVLYDSGNDYAIETLEARLGVQRRASLTLAVDNNDLSSGAAMPRTYTAAHMIEQCPMYADAFNTGGAGLSEQLWMQQLHVLAYCEDGEEFAFKISQGHEGYAETETRMKWNSRKAYKDKTGPTKCSTFSASASQCATCPHNGHITTPLQLGTPRDATLPHPYDQDRDGVFYMVAGADGEKTTRVQVFGYRVEDFGVYHTMDGVFLKFEAVGKGSSHHVELEYASLLDRKLCATSLSKNHVVLGYHEYTNFRDCMTSWTKRMQDARQVRSSWPHLGWSESPAGFVTGSHAFLQDGKIMQNLHPDKYLASMFQARGSRDPWIAVSKKLTGKGRHAIDAIFATAFGGPLMPFLRDAAALFATVSRKSGSGKSTALEAAQAVWGNPKSAMNQLDDTQASVYRKIAHVCNLPVYWDELRMKEEASRWLRMMFQMTAGKERSRLSQSADLKEVRMWNTIMTVASNESIASVTEQASKDSEAGRARVFEIVVPEILPGDFDTGLSPLMIELQTNYGVIGNEYAQFLAANTEEVKRITLMVYTRLSTKLLRDNVERFWISLMTALLAGAVIAKKLGYIHTDIAAFEKWLIQQFRLQQDDKQEEYGSGLDQSLDVVLDYMSQFRTQLVVCEKLPARPGTDIGRVFQEPAFGEIAGALAIKQSKIRLPRGAFREWMFRNGRGDLKSLTVALNGDVRRGVMTAGTNNQPSPFIRVLDIILPPGSYPMPDLDDEPPLFEET